MVLKMRHRVQWIRNCQNTMEISRAIGHRDNSPADASMATWRASHPAFGSRTTVPASAILSNWPPVLWRPICVCLRYNCTVKGEHIKWLRCASSPHPTQFSYASPFEMADQYFNDVSGNIRYIQGLSQRIALDCDHELSESFLHKLNTYVRNISQFDACF